MKKERADSNKYAELRQFAEEMLSRKEVKNVQKMKDKDVHALIHELQVHQIELEMQNQELFRTGLENEELREKYFDLYNHAPVGFFTFDKQGTILEVNQVGAAILDFTRDALINRRFQLFIEPASISVFNTFCKRVLETGLRQSCEIKLLKNERISYIQIEGIAAEDSQTGEKQCRAAIIDISGRKREEEKVRLLQTVSTAVSDIENLQSAVTILLHRVCEVTGWVYGEAWLPSAEDACLKFSSAWYSRDNKNLEEFCEKSQIVTFPSGIGLPGRVWSMKRALWIQDVTLDSDYLRAKIARDAGLKAGVAFPLLAGREVVAVIVAFMLEPLEKDERLLNLVSYISSQFGFIIKRKLMEETIRQMAYHDTLTDLPNRKLFEDHLALALAHAQRKKQNVMVLFLDLDRFKIINDTYGHTIGDQLLQGIAGRLKACLRKGDTVARLGGDEFILLIPEMNEPENAARIAQKVIETVKGPFIINNIEIQITTSIGIAVYPGDGEDIETLIQHADLAMYQAKEKGRNNYQFYSADLCREPDRFVSAK